MDDLEFRRRVFADPNTTDKDVTEAIRQDSEKAQLKSSLQGLDAKLSQAVKVPVPDDLAYKLIWQQATAEFNHHKKRSRWFIAMAASIAFVIGITGTVIYQYQPVDMGGEALAHVRHAEMELPGLPVEVGLQQVNAKLAGFGGSFSAPIGDVAVANYCHLNTTLTLHLIMNTEQGKVSVFVVPHKGRMSMPDSFSDEKYHGESWSMMKADIMVVGDKNADLEPVMKKVKRSITFSA
ncbi:DUF3379 family protein [Aestuariibacter sp. A3R04]|uniref:DUF3379 family protein n=1 Tax=Aestuariibacter sp. A3R04 TaxID=2841571 RepID=UPI001C08D00C|nr:DUF3379 family protein [Aestuariibacter sp. A3R04]MBU3022392.1 DUF3379 domain-containing protein [Aestuariibacter sp. A3R04]